ncbi:TspO/MBR family protein [Ectobacillus ponti]|uniref:Tryptophan-rich sensory protein n=1 Tax=Ectobacillus ponti TaxID=2961894 RepID=A0AA41X8Z7_9BACI|nr:TspO/MBR family protein [Ectobacillus ponti]MCP8967591.1 tryptophan-rich sensory protein [Ectobacillus ponti]
MRVSPVLLFVLIYMAFFLASWLFPIDRAWYDALMKPAWTPSGRAIGMIWGFLYGLIALAVIIVYRKYGLEPKSFYLVFFINYMFNQAYSYFQFARKDLLLATVDCLFVALTALFLIILAKRLSATAAVLLLPYFLWTSFATFLSWTIYRLNA